MIVIIEVEPDEGFVEELDIAGLVLCDRQAFHQDLHRMLEPMTDGLKLFSTLLEGGHEVCTGNLQETHAFFLIPAHSTAPRVPAAVGHLLIRVLLASPSIQEVLLADATEIEHVVHRVVELPLEVPQRVVQHAAPEHLLLEVPMHVD